jgi:hypothetical protein
VDLPDSSDHRLFTRFAVAMDLISGHAMVITPAPPMATIAPASSAT